MYSKESLGQIIKDARIKKGYSARELAKLCDISHTEINNIEKGERVRPAILTLKVFEKYLDLDFKELATLVGYSKDTIEYSDNNIIVSYERYDKKIREFELEKKFINDKLMIKKHLGIDIKKYFDPICEYLKSQENIDEDLIKKVNKINKLLEYLINN